MCLASDKRSEARSLEQKQQGVSLNSQRECFKSKKICFPHSKEYISKFIIMLCVGLWGLVSQKKSFNVLNKCGDELSKNDIPQTKPSFSHAFKFIYSKPFDH